MNKKTILINGYEYDASEGCVMTLMRVADKNGGKLSDYDFSQVVQEYGEDEDKVMEEMMDSKMPAFVRHSQGWDVTSD